MGSNPNEAQSDGQFRDEMLPRVAFGREELSAEAKEVRPRHSFGPEEAGAGVDRRPICLICGRPTWLDVSERPSAALWVCEDHIAPAYRLELFLAGRAFIQALIGEVVRPLEKVAERATALAGRVARYWVIR